MKKSLLVWAFLVSSFCAFSQNSYSIIPKPAQLTAENGQFSITKLTKIVVPANDAALQGVIEQLNLRFLVTTGQYLPVVTEAEGNHIYFVTKSGMNKEAYRLSVSPTKITVTASTALGHFYGMQTLLQLLPPEIFSSSLQTKRITWQVPACQITDEPRFGYRGGMLDVGRHFFSVDFIKKYIDLLALHKMNTFHWHLTEDQGWRIEIKKYPKLTEIGSVRIETMKGHYTDEAFDGTPYGGFYTQEQIKEIVRYAESRFVTVIPEIELPGHSSAALAAYPELGCEQKKYEVVTKWGVFEDIYCPSEKTFTFLEDVLSEVMELFPSQYIHIGGDEAPKKAWENSKFCQDLMKEKGLKDEHELQSYFIKRIDSFITSKGRKMIGWDEILEGGISPNATIMSWRGESGGIAAAKQNHDAIMTPTTYCYFDYYQADPATEPLAIGGFLPLEKVYGYNPVPKELSLAEAKHILGTQANLWTEYIPTPEKAEYMAYPRLSALAEVAWTPNERKNYDDFTNRLATHFERLRHLGVNYSSSLYNVSMKTGVFTRGQPVVKMNSVQKNAVIRYTVDGSQPNEFSPIYVESGVPIPQSATITAAAFTKEGVQLGQAMSNYYTISKTTGRPYTLTHLPQKYTGGETYGLSNGVTGSQKNTATWVGFEGKDMEAVFDFGRGQNMRSVSLGFLNNPKQWIAAPLYVEVLVSKDGKNYESIKKVDVSSTLSPNASVKQINVGLGENTNGRYIKIVAKNFGTLPKGNPGAGNSSWLFVDEIGID